jgi:hypothetical protein
MTLGEVAEVLEAAASKARELAVRERAAQREWADQGTSPLGRRRHCAAVRSRVRGGQPGAAVVGRRHLLSAEALSEELERLSKRPRPAEQVGVRSELERELRLVGSRR